jgi:hypothetical protein
MSDRKICKRYSEFFTSSGTLGRRNHPKGSLHPDADACGSEVGV